MRHLCRLLIFSWLVLAVSATLSGSPPAGPTVIRVLDPSGEPYADAVVLMNPGQPSESIALVTDSNGTAKLSSLNCKVCVVTALDPRKLFFDRTTEFQSGTPSVTLILAVRPVVDFAFDPMTVKVDVQVRGPDGIALADRDVVVRNRVGTIDDNTFSVCTTDRSGRLALELRPGEYAVASLVSGRFLEAPLDISLPVKRKCTEEESSCYIASAKHNRVPAHFSIRLASHPDSP